MAISSKFVDHGEFQSTLLMRGATRLHLGSALSTRISIHAPHARSDLAQLTCRRNADNFNPRSSCEERPRLPHRMIHDYQFQSTLLMRGATICSFLSFIFNLIFQSTLLMRGATVIRVDDHIARAISIHAPHARSDCSFRSSNRRHAYFNPRSSCEERRP